MLTALGRPSVERGKSIAIGLLVVLLAMAVWQVSDGRAVAARDQQDREAVAAVARRFAVALTTYDYGHPNVQGLALAAVSSSAVRQRVGNAVTDLVAARASSIGDVGSIVVLTLAGSTSAVLVQTVQIMSSRYDPTPTNLKGLLQVELNQLGGGWTVTDYSWDLAPEPS